MALLSSAVRKTTMAANTSRDEIDGAPAAVRAALARVSLALKDQDCLGASLALVDLEKVIDTFAPVNPPAEADAAVHLIYFDDADMRPEVWIGEGASRARFKAVSTSWNAHLFVKLESNSADDRWAKNNRAPASKGVAVPSVGDKADGSKAGGEARGTPGALRAPVKTVQAPLAVIEEWMHVPTLKLRAGEMKAQEVRTVIAVLSAIRAELVRLGTGPIGARPVATMELGSETKLGEGVGRAEAATAPGPWEFGRRGRGGSTHWVVFRDVGDEVPVEFVREPDGKQKRFASEQEAAAYAQPPASKSEVLLMALACLRWHCFGECRTQGWPGQPPTPADTAQALEAVLVRSPAASSQGDV